MDDNLALEAIDAALSGNWQKAILINSKIIKDNPRDIDALNRIARAFVEIDEMGKARTAAQKVLKIDPTNSIARKNLLKWKSHSSHEKTNNDGLSSSLQHSAFIEEPRKTRIVDLVNLGEISHINCLDCGDAVRLIAGAHRLTVVTGDDKYIGRFPDDLAARFIRLIKDGNSYETFIKSADKKQVKIFVCACPKSVL